MTPLKLACIIWHLFKGMLVCGVLFPLSNGARRQAHVRRWSGQLLALCGMRLEVQVIDGAAGGDPLHAPIPPRREKHFTAHQSGVMLIANHVSWLDIFVINAWHPVRFVAKSDIRRWPLIGWLCAAAGTLFIDRESRTAVRHMLHAVAGELQAGHAVCIFPEGTTSDGSGLLPFHANLLQAPLAAGAPIRAIALRYVDGVTGEFTSAPAYVGEMSLMDSLRAIFRATPITARLIIGPVLDTAHGERRLAAQQGREAIAALLGV